MLKCQLSPAKRWAYVELRTCSPTHVHQRSPDTMIELRANIEKFFVKSVVRLGRGVPK